MITLQLSTGAYQYWKLKCHSFDSYPPKALSAPLNVTGGISFSIMVKLLPKLEGMIRETTGY